MLGYRVTKTTFIFGKELYIKEIIAPQEFEYVFNDIDMDIFLNYALLGSVRTLNNLGYSIPDISKGNVMWLESTIQNEYVCLFGTKKGFVSTTFALYCYEK